MVTLTVDVMIIWQVTRDFSFTSEHFCVFWSFFGLNNSNIRHRSWTSNIKLPTLRSMVSAQHSWALASRSMLPASAFRQLSPVPVYSGTGLFLDYRDNEYQTSYPVKLFDYRNHMKISTLNVWSCPLSLSFTWTCPFPLFEPVPFLYLNLSLSFTWTYPFPLLAPVPFLYLNLSLPVLFLFLSLSLPLSFLYFICLFFKKFQPCSIHE